MNEIEAWLSGTRDFQQGIELLKQYDPKNRVIAICESKGESTMSRPKLTKALRSIRHLADFDPPKERKRPSPPKELGTTPHLFASPGVQHPYPKGDDLYPPEIAAAIQTRRRVANDRDRLANTLADLTSDADRAAVRQKLEELHEELQKFNTVVGTWERTGKLPARGAAKQVAAPHLSKDERSDLMRQRDNLRTYISRAKRNRKKWMEKKDASEVRKRNRLREIREQIEDWESQIEAIEQQMNHEGTEEPQPTR